MIRTCVVVFKNSPTQIVTAALSAVRFQQFKGFGRQNVFSLHGSELRGQLPGGFFAAVERGTNAAVDASRSSLCRSCCRSRFRTAGDKSSQDAKGCPRGGMIHFSGEPHDTGNQPEGRESA